MSARRSATARLERLLALVPWVAARPDGASVSEVCSRFGVNRAELADDIDTVMMTGIHPFTPDTLIDAQVEGDRVTIRYADEFARPLRLTGDEAVALIAAARGLAAVPGRTEDDPLERAIDKLESTLPAGGLRVDLGDAADETFGVLEVGLADRNQVEIDYVDIEGDRVVTRRVEPANLFSSAGTWYVSGWCHHAGGPRIFRVDRILAARPTGEAFADERAGAVDVDFDPTLPQATLDVERRAAWLLDNVPLLAREEHDGSVRVRLAVGSPRWFARFLLQLGDAATVVEADPSLDPEAARRSEADKILARYR